MTLCKLVNSQYFIEQYVLERMGKKVLENVQITKIMQDEIKRGAIWLIKTTKG